MAELHEGKNYVCSIPSAQICVCVCVCVYVCGGGVGGPVIIQIEYEMHIAPQCIDFKGLQIRDLHIKYLILKWN
jgi:hypothetical protein